MDLRGGFPAIITMTFSRSLQEVQSISGLAFGNFPANLFSSWFHLSVLRGVPSPENQSAISGAARSPRRPGVTARRSRAGGQTRREPLRKVRSAEGDRVSPERRPPKPCRLSAPFLFVPPLSHSGASLVAQLVKNLQCGRPGFDPWVGEIPWERRPTPVFWPWESQRVGQDWATSLFHSDTDSLMLPSRLAPIHPVLQPFLTSHEGAVS